MPEILASESALINAAPETVYSILADYRVGHPAILPRKYFLGLEVEKGGVGQGTVIRFQMRVLGTTRTLRAEVSEPVPGRVLVEHGLDSGPETTFTVEPADAGKSGQVTFTTRYSVPGLRGWVESLIAPRLLRHIYKEELQNLARRAAL